MNSRTGRLAVILVLQATAGQAAVQAFAVKTRLAILEAGGLRHEVQRRSTHFQMDVVSDWDGDKGESVRNGRSFITAQNGEPYSIRLHNPLPVQVAVNLTVDGLNSITGKPSGIADGAKWLIPPYGQIVIRGWQVSGWQARRFFFTDKPKSYAKWREEITGLRLSDNCGVIGAAFFWNQQELDRYYDSTPIVRDGLPQTDRFAAAAKSQRAAAPTALGAAQQAGTGMGEREYNPTIQVDFRYDTGMYSAKQALLVYYDFSAPRPARNPFPALTYAPEMPR